MRSPTSAVARRGASAVGRSVVALVLICATTLLFEVVAPTSAWAATLPVPLGTAGNFAVLAGTTVTNTGVSMINGDLGVSPGTAVTGVPPAQINGTVHAGDATAAQAQADLAVAYQYANTRPVTASIAPVLDGQTLLSGVYDSPSGTFANDATVTLDAKGDPNAVFIFKALTTVITGAGSIVRLIDGAQSCNVFWVVGSSATFGADSIFRGDVMADISITVGARVEIDGRAMANKGAVTMNTDQIRRSTCAPPGALSISAPTTADLGSAAPGGSVSDQLAPVTVTDDRRLTDGDWQATVTATNFVLGGSPATTVAPADVSYWSGPATVNPVNGAFVSGQPTSGDAETLDESRVAFTFSNGFGNTFVTWEPTLTVQLPFSAVGGAYTFTVTFSVA